MLRRWRGASRLRERAREGKSKTNNFFSYYSSLLSLLFITCISLEIVLAGGFHGILSLNFFGKHSSSMSF